jgi:hypothetical protein
MIDEFGLTFFYSKFILHTELVYKYKHKVTFITASKKNYNKISGPSRRVPHMGKGIPAVVVSRSFTQ